MGRHSWQAALAAAVWTVVLIQADVPLVLSVLIPLDVALLALAAEVAVTTDVTRWEDRGIPSMLLS